MEKERDNIDIAIQKSFTKIEPSIDYNSRLMKRIYKKNSYKQGRTNTVAASFILAGFLSMFLYTSNVEFKIIDFKCRVESQMFAIQHNYTSDISRILLGE